MAIQNKKLIVIAGPTAIGKTSLAIELAKTMEIEIFSADSRQVYKEMTIGTAKPNPDELASVKHHMIDVISIHDPWDVYQYEQSLISKLQDYFKLNNTALLVGGTGLYIKAVLEGLNQFPDIDPNISAQIEALYASEGIDALAKKLSELDPQYYSKVDKKNPRRLIRALSVILSSGQTFSHFINKKQKPRDFSSICLRLTMERNLLYDRINIRVDQMIENGLLNEIENLYPHRNLKALQTIGYKELFQYRDGEISLDTAIDKIKQHSRNYAKRQITWFSNNYNGFDVEPKQLNEIKGKLGI